MADTDDKAQPGGEHQFATGGKRSEVKPYYSAVPAQSLRRLALRATGAPKGQTRHDEETGFIYSGGSDGYGYSNWQQGLPMEDTFNHVIEHLWKWKTSIEKGQISKDDDLAAAAWGIMMPLMTFEMTYARAYRERHKIGFSDPRMVDAAMGELGNWIQPLAPKKVEE